MKRNQKEFKDKAYPDLDKEVELKKPKRPSGNNKKDKYPEFKPKDVEKVRIARTFATNDFAWMNKYPELIDNAARLIQNFIPGTKRDIGRLNSLSPLYQSAGLGIPMLVTPGMCSDATDSFNMQMHALWLTLHRKYRGLPQYQSADLGVFIFCIMQLFAFIAEGERAYGVCAYYDARNRHIPAAYPTLLHWDFTSLRSDMAAFRGSLNRLIIKAQALCLPKGFAIFDDLITLFSNVFRDRPEWRSQLLVATLGYTWTYTGTRFSTGSGAYADRVVSPWTSTSYLLKLESMIDALILDDDVTKACSDILAAFGDGDIVRMFTIPENYQVIPVYDEIRSLQFHNLVTVHENEGSWNAQFNNVCTARDTRVTGYTNEVELYQYDNTVQFRASANTHLATQVYAAPSGSGNIQYATRNHGTTAPSEGALTADIIDTWHNEANAEIIAESSKFMITLNRQTVVGSGTPYLSITYIRHGIYIPMVIEAVCMTAPGTYTPYYMASNFESVSSFMYSSEAVALVTAVDNAPLITVLNSGHLFIQGEVENIIFTNEVDLSNLFNVVCLSEWKLDYLDIIK